MAILTIGDLLGVGPLRWAMLLGAVAGAIYALGNAGLIPAWGDGKRQPAVARAILALVLAVALASGADSATGALLLGLSGLGAAKAADLLVSAAFEVIRAVR